jgi:hypothetical protein
MFIVERRDGSHFVGNLYKTEAKAKAVCHTYLKNDPHLLKHGYVFKIGVDASNVIEVENELWIEDEHESAKVDRERAQAEYDELLKQILAPMGIVPRDE